ncbi:hypothetical protein J4E90_010033 [Alternaria incomplexa]|uniref:uncharacterized protein n=1 Tax=Alternaria incomplexa TaxID=1187928 RepID=UPI00221FE37E|nr:uncharacterized protein J4E90_010033 [Alternaria incomplexa]KAI4906830.1 hypothetical protein J4E90_010033 [Alternaria incomplexa]
MSMPQQLPPPGVAATNCFPAGSVPNQQYYSHMPGDDYGEIPPTWPTTPSVPVPSAPTKRKRQSGEEDEVPKVPKKRGRPPKAKPVVEVQVPKKRGRPPKARPVVVLQVPTPDTTTTTTTTTNSSSEENFAFEAAPFAGFNEYTIDQRVEAGIPCRLQERGQDSAEAVETVDNLPAFSFPAYSAAESIWEDAPMVQEPWIRDVAPAENLPAFFSSAYPAVDSMWADPPLPQEPEIVEQNSAGEIMDAMSAAAAADDGAANAAIDDFVCDWNGNNPEDMIF